MSKENLGLEEKCSYDHEMYIFYFIIKNIKN
jgi:hypothetical protein